MTGLINSLPSEVVEHILGFDQIEFADCVNLGLTCRQFYKIIASSDKLWRRKFFQRWPLVKESYDQLNDEQKRAIEWRKAAQIGVTNRRKLLHRISLMSGKHYEKDEISNHELREFDELHEDMYPLVHHVLIDKLLTLLRQPAETSNLTERYYALKVLRYLKQNYLKGEWERFISLPEEQQTMERVATIVAQWCQPEKQLWYSQVAETLDSIAEQAKEVLREERPSHPIFSAPREHFLSWRNKLIEDNQWSGEESREVMEAVSKVLFDVLGFRGSRKMYDNLEYILIDHVLQDRCGIHVNLSIIFESVARRLGVRCEPVNFPSHFLLKWKERYNIRDAKDPGDYYIDVFRHGGLLTKRDCPRIGGESYCPFLTSGASKAATAAKIARLFVTILERSVRQHDGVNGGRTRSRSVLELRHMIDPDCIDTVYELARFHVNHHMDRTDVLKILADMQKKPELRERAGEVLAMLNMHKLPKQLEMSADESTEDAQRRRISENIHIRTPSVKYAVGLIMTHAEDGFLCVITDWELTGESRNGSDLPQVLYNILGENGIDGYVEQERLFLATEPRWIKHDEVGRHFRRFRVSRYYYEPNEEKAREYPEDEAVCDEMTADLSWAYHLRQTIGTEEEQV